MASPRFNQRPYVSRFEGGEDSSTIFAQLKPYLFSVAYNILGEIPEAEDIVQDAFESFLKKRELDVHNTKSYLTRVVANKAIDRLKALQKARESYFGTWLPEPVVDFSFPTVTDEGVMSYEAMVALEKLTPVERGVFVLREAFEYSFADLSQLFGLSEENVRQVLHRGRKKANQKGMSSQKRPGDNAARQLVESFLKACTEGDTKQFETLLKDDVALYSDGGGKVKAAVNSLHGPETVAKFLLGIFRKSLPFNVELRQATVNGAPAFVTFVGGEPYSVSYLSMTGDSVENIYIIRNPDKIQLK
ncbi:MAG: sigma-70 family RNA polymerase sigma factor [Imperialibacter sp.]|uniref:sigma-70 family RNA polymerase sigma factor n=1 Tax=Imperialibacter sp. TaxID=2038411 RepID=UPI0032EB0F73